MEYTVSVVYKVTINKEKMVTRQNNVIFLATKSSLSDAYACKVLAEQLGGKIIQTGNTKKDINNIVGYVTKNLSTNDKIYIIGLEKAIKNDVETILKKKGYKNIVRIGGEDKYETAKLITEYLNPAKGTKVALVNGDTLSASEKEMIDLCAEHGYPVLYVKKNSITEYSTDALLKIAPSEIYIIGDEEQVSNSVIKNLKKQLKLKSKDVIRIDSNQDLSAIN